MLLSIHRKTCNPITPHDRCGELFNSQSYVMSQQPNILSQSLKNCSRHFTLAFIFAAACNVLILASPLFTLQVYDRVLSSQSIPTLVVLTGIALVTFIAFTVIDIARSSVLRQAALRLDRQVGQPLMATTFCHPSNGTMGQSANLLRDLDTVRAFMSGPGVIALTDLPWAPPLLLIITLIHPWLGIMALVSCLVLATLAFLSERLVAGKNLAGQQQLQENYRAATSIGSRSETVMTMGMGQALLERWWAGRRQALLAQKAGAGLAALFASLSKGVRMMVQTAMIALGAWLAVRGEITPGGMIAASIIVGRVLAPIDQGINAWKQWRPVREAWSHLQAAIANVPADHGAKIRQPSVNGHLRFERVSYYPNKQNRPILGQVSFTLKPGTLIAVIGKSGTGKTTLARLITSAYQPAAGRILLDNTDMANWDRAQLSEVIGYCPQNVEMLEGSVRQNIARFAHHPDDAVIRAAQLAGIHEVIMALPQGYETHLGGERPLLSQGQLKRVAIARALLGKPNIIVLDEPEAGLDQEARWGLIKTLKELQRQSVTVIVMTHNPEIMAAMEALMVLENRTMSMYGPVRGVSMELNKRRNPNGRASHGIDLPELPPRPVTEADSNREPEVAVLQ